MLYRVAIRTYMMMQVRNKEYDAMVENVGRTKKGRLHKEIRGVVEDSSETCCSHGHGANVHFE